MFIIFLKQILYIYSFFNLYSQTSNRFKKKKEVKAVVLILEHPCKYVDIEKTIVEILFTAMHLCTCYEQRQKFSK